ncbi:sensor histidine kinase [Pantanalinema sp. GBBB05]|uniref:sensor histidine kinase n=1 Tax=Pantanalinema sp. GBBB05 TaxID=2604139 RepID=UPI001D2DD8BF|nr:sensor histidine kinase [Pantanalinema sp. GBBB05]
MFQTTRRRLALWYTTVTAVLLLLFASGFYLYVRSTLIERIDDTLNHVVEVVQRSLVIESINPHFEGSPLRVNIEASFRDNATPGEDDHIDLEWFSPSGALLWSTLSEPLDIPLQTDSFNQTVRVERRRDGGTGEKRGDNGDKDGRADRGDGGVNIVSSSSSPSSSFSPPSSSLSSYSDPLILRQVTQRVTIGHQLLGYLRVSHPWFEVTKPTRRLVVDLSLGTGLVLVVVGAIGWWLSDLAMEPVRESYQRLKQFTADASHELRSPIAVIQTNVQVALADPNPDLEMQRQHLQVVERLTRRLGRLVDDLLFLARQDSGMVQLRWSSVALDELLQEVVEELRSLATDKHLKLLLTGFEPNANYGLYGDRDQLIRLFTNLVGNAVQYTLVNGRITVELRQIKRGANAAFQVTIQDTGIGIPAEALPHVFDRFYRVDPARSQTATKGSGLGLAIAQVIVEKHQGQIQVSSTVGQGTTVTVVLPQREE